MSKETPAQITTPRLVVEKRPVLFTTPPDRPHIGRDPHNPEVAVPFHVTAADLDRYARLSQKHSGRFTTQIDVDHNNSQALTPEQIAALGPYEPGKGPSKGSVRGGFYTMEAINPDSGKMEPCLACDFEVNDPDLAIEVLRKGWERSSLVLDDSLFDVVGDVYPSWLTLLGNGHSAVNLPPTSEYVTFVAPDVADAAQRPIMLSRGAVERLTGDAPKGDRDMSTIGLEKDDKAKTPPPEGGAPAVSRAEFDALMKQVQDSKTQIEAAEKRAKDAEDRAEKAEQTATATKESGEQAEATREVEAVVATMLSRGLLTPAEAKVEGFKGLLVNLYRDRQVAGRAIMLSRGDGKDKKDETIAAWDVLLRVLESRPKAVALGRVLGNSPAADASAPKGPTDEEITKSFRDKNPGWSKDQLESAVNAYKDQLQIHQNT